MKSLFILCSIVLMAITAIAQESIHQYTVTDLMGEEFSFSDLKGKKILVVNTASKCGLTPQYEDLQALHKKYGDRLAIVGFPANNFGAQEPGTDVEIAAFCEKNYGVEFLMMSKVSVKGEDICEVYQFLTQKEKNGIEDSEVTWNFQKYLLDEKGKLIKVFSPRVKPLDSEIVEMIK
jgi:glutathione peroxidase